MQERDGGLSEMGFQGHEAASKLFASTLDRYWGRVGQPQVLGTPLRKMPGDTEFSTEFF